MKRHSFPLPARLRPIVAAAAWLACASAQAVITAPADPSTVVDYGNGGNVFQLAPMLFVQGLGNANSPESVVALNPALQFSTAVTGLGSSLMTIDYRVKNTSTTLSFSDLRFMLFANPDGDSTNFLDKLSETWGAAATGDPTRREGRAAPGNPFDSILARFGVNANLTETPTAIDAACQAAVGCDAVVGLQWNEAALAPGETFRVRVGLSDDGQRLSTRWIDAVAVDSPNTTLTLSGQSSIIPVPEPASVLLLAAGLAAVGAAARRRQG